MDSNLLKKLRNATNAGFVDCKTALEETDNNFDKAVEWLRKKGVVKAEKKLNADATEGVIAYKNDGKKAVMMEINSQTDFVAKNELFTNFVNNLLEKVFASNVNTVNEAMDMIYENNISVRQKILELIATIGEKISFRRLAVVKVDDSGVLGGYLHVTKKIGVIIASTKTDDQDALKKISMHIAAMSPKFIDDSKVDETWKNKEREIILQQTINEGKNKEFADKIVEGRMIKLLKETTMIYQEFVVDQSITVGDFLKNKNIKVVDMIRFEVGEKS